MAVAGTSVFFSGVASGTGIGAVSGFTSGTGVAGTGSVVMLA